MATKITTPELFNLSSNNTAATQLPVFTTSERPTPTTSTVQVEYLVIGGGGAGGGWGGGGGAGGYLTNYGGSKTPLTSSANYAIVVGEGGVKQTVAATAANSGEDSSIIGTGISITATGGGAGGTKNGNTTEFIAQNGGSGGGASAMRSASVGGSGNTPSTTPSQGNNGGNSPAQDPNFPGGGGGGGANANGGDGQSASGSPAYAGGDGGNGLASLITGTSVTRAGGGGGFTYGISVTNVSSGGTGGGGAGGRYVSSGNSTNPSPSNAVDGQVNTGSGGGSGSVTQSGSGSSWYGGDTASGGSGIVILRYPTSSSSVIKTTGSLVYTESTDGSDTVIQFTEGSGNVSFASAGIAVGEMIFNSTTEKVEYWDGFQWNMIKDEAIYEPFSDAFFNELWYSADFPYNTCPNNRATVSSTVADFNTYSEGQIDFNTTAKTSGKWYIEIKQLASTAHNGYSVFQKSGNTTYNTPPYVSSNPIDGNYGITLYSIGNRCYIGNVEQFPQPGLAITTNQIACIAVDVDNQKVWFGKKTSATATSVTWVSGTNPATNTGGYSVGFTEFDPMVSHVSESSSRASEFGYVPSTDFTTPTGFENWKGDFASTLTVNCSTH